MVLEDELLLPISGGVLGDFILECSAEDRGGGKSGLRRSDSLIAECDCGGVKELNCGETRYIQ